jgi:hypothetical protein
LFRKTFSNLENINFAIPRRDENQWLRAAGILLAGMSKNIIAWRFGVHCNAYQS